MRIEPTGKVIIDTCSVQGTKCVAKAPASITIVRTPARSEIKVCSRCIEEKIRKGEWEVEGAKIQPRADLAVFSGTGKLVLIVEVTKAPQSVSDEEEWATSVHRNLLIHSAIPLTPFFILAALPNHLYLWRQLSQSALNHSSDFHTSHFTKAAYSFLKQPPKPDYRFQLSKLLGVVPLANIDVSVDSDEVRFTNDIADWLTLLTNRRTEHLPEETRLEESGLLSALKGGSVSTHASIPTTPFGDVAGLTVLKILTDAALTNLPKVAMEREQEWETIRRALLQQLLKIIQSYTGTKSEVVRVPKAPESFDNAESQLYGFLEDHWSLYGGEKRKVISDYLEKARDRVTSSKRS